MRSQALNTLFADVSQLAGVGKRVKALLSNLVKEKSREPVVKDLLFHLPISFVDRRNMPNLHSAVSGEILTAIVEITEHIAPPHRSRRPYRIICRNETGFLTIIFFNSNMRYLLGTMPVGSKRVVSGKAEVFDGILQMPHPDHIGNPSELEKIRRAEPIYPLTYGISQKVLGKIIHNAEIPDLPEWIESEMLKKQGWESWKTSLEKAHSPSTLEDLDPKVSFRSRLAYDELLANQLALALTRKTVSKQAGQSINGDGALRRKLLSSLPFKLTNGQEVVLKESLNDIGSDNRMIRLLQGDVGSGKTVVALLLMLNAIECGKQAAIMAPTEILSRQHFSWMEKVIREAGLENDVKIGLLTGSIKGKQRQEILESFAKGDIDLIIGTHALFQESVEFYDLSLIVIDEQHRFGVKQRLMLSAKGNRTDILLMSATPIPRTLTLTLYGDMEISILKEKPSGRTPIETRVIPLQKVNDVIIGLKRAIANGERIYWVCPLIDESEESDLAAAEERFKILRKTFGKRIGLIHGRMKSEEKERIMSFFKDGELDILVATTVIEVGVDVPEATVMVIEEAERFGLSQLHQLRGRVGRHSKQSSCILLYGNDITDTGKRRLKILRETEDGFKIAEEDLMIRGGGEMLGTKQSGMPDFKLAVFPEHGNLLLVARDDVKLILESDNRLTSERGNNLRTLLYLFEYDSQMKYLMSG